MKKDDAVNENSDKNDKNDLDATPAPEFSCSDAHAASDKDSTVIIKDMPALSGEDLLDKAQDKPASKPDDPATGKRSSAASGEGGVSIEKLSATPKKQAEKKQRPRKKYNIWWIKAAVISLVLAAFFSFLSELTASAENIVIIILLLAFLITASILFDAIGVAVTSCDPTPIVSMSSRKIYGARTALWLVKNSGTVSSICNDVIGDIFGIISGACSAAIVLKITISLGESWQRWLSIGISAVVSALTIGGKAFMKNIAISNSREFVMFVARCLAIFNKDERKIKKRDAQKKKQQREQKNRDDKNAEDRNV